MHHGRDHRDFHFGHFAHFAMGRHGGRHRFGRGGHGFFGGGPGGDFPGARRLSSQDLQLVILALLTEKPAHGYELIKIIEERSDGFYTPSPGVIYPALTYLEEVGHSSVAQDGGRKLYSITPQGEAHLAENRATADAILQALSRIGRRMDEVREPLPVSAISMRVHPTSCTAPATISSARCAPGTAATPPRPAASLRSWIVPPRKSSASNGPASNGPASHRPASN